MHSSRLRTARSGFVHTYGYFERLSTVQSELVQMYFFQMFLKTVLPSEDTQTHGALVSTFFVNGLNVTLQGSVHGESLLANVAWVDPFEVDGIGVDLQGALLSKGFATKLAFESRCAGRLNASCIWRCWLGRDRFPR